LASAAYRVGIPQSQALRDDLASMAQLSGEENLD
jgi:hypothetical protein